MKFAEGALRGTFSVTDGKVWVQRFLEMRVAEGTQMVFTTDRIVLRSLITSFINALVLLAGHRVARIPGLGAPLLDQILPATPVA